MNAHGWKNGKVATDQTEPTEKLKPRVSCRHYFLVRDRARGFNPALRALPERAKEKPSVAGGL
jgi:hypothetical protein